MLLTHNLQLLMVKKPFLLYVFCSKTYVYTHRNIHITIIYTSQVLPKSRSSQPRSWKESQILGCYLTIRSHSTMFLALKCSSRTRSSRLHRTQQNLCLPTSHKGTKSLQHYLKKLLISKTFQNIHNSEKPLSLSLCRFMLEQKITTCLNASRYFQHYSQSYQISFSPLKRFVTVCVYRVWSGCLGSKQLLQNNKYPKTRTQYTPIRTHRLLLHLSFTKSNIR